MQVDKETVTRSLRSRGDHDRAQQAECALSRQVDTERDAGLLQQLDVDVAAIVSYLEGHGYGGWYVLEQDTILPGAPSGEGPVVDVRTSVEYLRGLFAKVAS